MKYHFKIFNRNDFSCDLCCVSGRVFVYINVWRVQGDLCRCRKSQRFGALCGRGALSAFSYSPIYTHTSLHNPFVTHFTHSICLHIFMHIDLYIIILHIYIRTHRFGSDAGCWQKIESTKDDMQVQGYKEIQEREEKRACIFTLLCSLYFCQYHYLFLSLSLTYIRAHITHIHNTSHICIILTLRGCMHLPYT